MDQFLLEVGPRLRKRRRDLKLAQQEVAERSGITKGMISKLETGRAIPSLPVLLRLLEVLDFAPEFFFHDSQQKRRQPYVHRTAREAMPLEREITALGFNYRELLQGEGRDFALRAVLLEVEPDSHREQLTTDAYEYKYVLQGELDYQIGEETLRLRKGDSLFYDGRLPHVPINRGTEKAIMLVIYLHDHLL